MSADSFDMLNGCYRRIYAGCTRGRRINSVSVVEELVFWRLHCVCDDFGTFEADPYLATTQAFPRRREITEAVMSEALGKLEGGGLIELYEVNGERYGRIVDFEKLQPAGRNGKRFRRHPAKPGESGCIQTDPGDSRGIRGTPGEPCAHNNYNNDHNNDHDKPKGKAKPAADAAAVEEIYQAYPRKVSKGAALKAIPVALAKIGKRPDAPADPAAWLLERVRRFAGSPAGTRGKFTPHPATWFNEGRYDDDPGEWFREDGAKSPPRSGPPSPSGSILKPVAFGEV